MLRPAQILPLSLLLAGCASGPAGEFPALGKRPIEERFAVVESVPLPPPGPLPTDLTERLAGWRARATAADAAFRAALPATDAAVAAAAGTAPPGERWIAAQQALSRLAVARGPVMDALGDVDALYLARQDAGEIDGLPDLLALRDQLAAWLGDQDTVLAGLAERLGA